MINSIDKYEVVVLFKKINLKNNEKSKAQTPSKGISDKMIYYSFSFDFQKVDIENEMLEITLFFINKSNSSVNISKDVTQSEPNLTSLKILFNEFTTVSSEGKNKKLTKFINFNNMAIMQVMYVFSKVDTNLEKSRILLDINIKNDQQIVRNKLLKKTTTDIPKHGIKSINIKTLNQNSPEKPKLLLKANSKDNNSEKDDKNLNDLSKKNPNFTVSFNNNNNNIEQEKLFSSKSNSNKDEFIVDQTASFNNKNKIDLRNKIENSTKLISMFNDKLIDDNIKCSDGIIDNILYNESGLEKIIVPQFKCNESIVFRKNTSSNTILNEKLIKTISSKQERNSLSTNFNKMEIDQSNLSPKRNTSNLKLINSGSFKKSDVIEKNKTTQVNILTSTPKKLDIPQDPKSKQHMVKFKYKDDISLNNIKDDSNDKNTSILNSLHRSERSNLEISFSEVNIKNHYDKIDSIELEINDYFKYNLGDSLSEIVFITGINYSDPKVITEVDAEVFDSSCKHSKCKLSTAYKPEILSYYPGKCNEEEIELTNLNASLCFTKGIKICHEKEEKNIVTPEDYMVIITNEEGKRYYQYMYKFYVKMDYSEFQKIFNTNPLSQQLKNPNIPEDKLQNLSELSCRDNIYIPYSLAIISKFPFTKLFTHILKLMTMIVFGEYKQNITETNDMSLGLNKYELVFHSKYKSLTISSVNLLTNLLKNIIYEISISNISMRLNFPFIGNFEVNLNRDLPNFAYNIHNIFNHLSIEIIVLVYHLMLHEQKILFIGKSEKSISELLEIMRILTYPLIWNNTFISVLSEELVRYLQCMVPFMMGIEENLLYIAKEHLECQDSVFIINISKNTIDFNKKRINKKSLK